MDREAWVLDTSVAVPWFFTDEPTRQLALEVRETLKADPDSFYVPSLFHSELVHVLARKSGRDVRFTREAIRLILRLGLRTLPLSEAGLLGAARWACRGLSGYDATFVSLAEELGAVWITADERAAEIAGPKLARVLVRWAAQRGTRP